MSSTAVADSIEAVIQGSTTGQIAVGKDIHQTYSVQLTSYGGVVNLGPARALPRPRSGRPIFTLRPFPGLLDRAAEAAAAAATLQIGAPVELYGEPGIGKTALLRHLAHQPVAASFRDGALCLPPDLVHDRPLEDLLQTLWEAFYECETPYKPGPAELREGLRDKQSLFVLDDLSLRREEVEALLEALPAGALLMAAADCHLWGEGRAIALKGLPEDSALALLERALGRSLAADEQPSARAIWSALGGHPLRILQTAARSRVDGVSLSDLARELRADRSRREPVAAMLPGLPGPQQQVLAALAAPPGLSLDTQHLASLAGLADPAPALEALLQRGLVQEANGRYSLAGGVDQAAAEIWEAQPRAERALEHFTAWVDQRQDNLDLLAQQTAPVLRLLEWAAQAGQWLTVAHLARTFSDALAQSGQWGAWARVLGWQLQAARELGDRQAEAWALHQLGTRALCLEDLPAARTSLQQALTLRESLGDRAGAAVTRHNLELLAPPPPVRLEAESASPKVQVARRGPAGWLGRAALVGLLLAAAAVGIRLLGPPAESVSPTPTTAPAAATALPTLPVSTAAPMAATEREPTVVVPPAAATEPPEPEPTAPLPTAEATSPPVVDSSPPEILVEVSPRPNPAGWHNAEVTVDWSVRDDQSDLVDESGCASTTVDQETSELVLTCRATNAAGLEASRQVTIRVDRTPPEIRGNRAPPPNAAGWNTSNVTVSFGCDDELSGVVKCEPSRLVLSDEGAGQTVSGTAADRAGNSVTIEVGKINLDPTAPATELATSPAPGRSGWYREPVTVTLQAEDATSGLAATRFSVDADLIPAAQAGSPYRAPFTVGEGRHRLSFFSVDRAGNVEKPRTREIDVDSRAPGPTSATLPRSGGIVMNSSDSQPGSGLAGIFYQWRQVQKFGNQTAQVVPLADYQRYANPLSAPSPPPLVCIEQSCDEELQLWAFSQDRAGNQEEAVLVHRFVAIP